MQPVHTERLLVAGHDTCPELQYFLNRTLVSVSPRWKVAAGLTVI